MSPIGSLLWRHLRVYQIYGSNTDVGKTIFTSIFCNASSRLWKHETIAYLKPVSTGPEDEADDNHIGRFTNGVARRTLYQFSQPVSPHIAANGNVISDERVLKSVYEYASERASAGPGWLFIETAGGTHSPGPSGTPQADLYAALRCPVVLVGDWKLGGISSTLSAFECLKIRGYDVESIVLFEDEKYGNSDYLKQYFEEQYGLPVMALPTPPPLDNGSSKKNDHELMLEYYLQASQAKEVEETLVHLDDRFKSRIKALESMTGEAHQKIWYPFTQQKLLQPKDIVPIDSASGSYFQTLVPQSFEKPTGTSLLQPSFDGSASWWTQGLGHGNTSLTLAAAYAAGRYGHVMFAGMIHKPALDLASSMLQIAQNPRLSRVFFSDNGSTGMEVAVKMALRAARTRYGWSPDTKIDILGLKGSYHGDTIGTMDCAEPNTFNEKVEWYEGKGVWLDYPQIQCVAGEWQIQAPNEFGTDCNHRFPHLTDIFNLEQRIGYGDHKLYEKYILSTLQRHLDEGRKFGALILEPVVLGAGGMVLVDPLFQKTLVDVVRQNPSIFGSGNSRTRPSDNRSWSGLPVVFDEVFTGLYRLGRPMAATFLDSNPDISVHAKLMTGGLVPLCVTLASECIFNAFASEEKSDALLHGHSYTAHPVGCQVAIDSLKQLQSMDKSGNWNWAKSNGWLQANNDIYSKLSQTNPRVWSIWPLDLIQWISLQTKGVAGVWAMGSVLAIHLRASDGSGYASRAAEGLRKRLLAGSGSVSIGSWNVHSRVLGNVLYIMGGQRITEQEVEEISKLLRIGLGECL
ncbi:bifunctional dethiobiotin synthetase/adenosylmethionine-8-amino-7-oxononanoate aminotransferase [Xylaria bambusicola]|uniref:bifunctional dethiobiotin synthetase/adenosylmethionine-8-amino-7-oxononanoate aminotransferase n=1 Tax=Xylaria bambusicola TaxID=326684 RepID=UPI0020087BD7|nr:bifunctional dethiobiotin synthetase/adenosylmethionine-8-amino-7-oxononanoate aminotransferase [Xylaria bambusicola]KAI0505588.1 bifunctional dethiobiotin synthetase/adenosylmethionine-8-amino-7-oxononanoate aminotransferase [Xylaria bambusicola]